MEYFHEPVLLQEVLHYVNPQPGQNFVDATLGAGGYSLELLKQVQPGGKVLSVDLDAEAVKNYELRIKSARGGSERIMLGLSPSKLMFSGGNNAIIVHGNFRELSKIVEKHKFNNISGIVADLGFSSPQLDESGRGFSFQKKEPLDMRLDISSQGRDANFILNNESLKALVKIFKDYGEERFALAIAKKIVQSRTVTPFHYTTDLTDVIKLALPKPKQHLWADSARRIFQSLRIAVNHELENLQEFLPQALDIINPGGFIAVVSFQSLEDRIVKQFFVAASQGCVCPIDFPECVCGRNPKGKILTKKPIRPSEEEIKNNSRSKPAKLRVLQKIK